MVSPAWPTRPWLAWIAIRAPMRPAVVDRVRSAALRIATAAWAARRGASSTGSSPKTATTSVGPSSSTRPPKLSTFSTRTSKARAVSGTRSLSDGGTRTARRNASRRRSQGRASRAGPAWGGRRGGVPMRRPVGGPREAGGGSLRWRPSFSIRYRSVPRGICSRAAARAMFQSVSSRASMRCSRSTVPIASLRGRGRARGSGAVPAGPGVVGSPRASAVTSGVSVSRAARSITFASSRMLPGQRIREERRPRVGGERLRGQAVVGAGPREEVLGQEEDVRPPLGERGEPHGDDGEPVIEVLAESASPHRLQEVLARRRGDRDVGRLALRAAEPPHRPVLEDLQELRLDALRQEADLVEEEDAAVRGLEETRLGLARVGEGPRSKPNSSASSRVSGIAAQFTSTSGPAARGLPGEGLGPGGPCPSRLAQDQQGGSRRPRPRARAAAGPSPGRPGSPGTPRAARPAGSCVGAILRSGRIPARVGRA